MDGAELTLTEPMFPTMPLGGMDVTNLQKQVLSGAVSETDGLAEGKKKQVAKDFESIFIGKLFDQADRAIGDWGFEEPDGVSSQVRGLFWLFLAREVADKGGLGLWKDVYQFLNDTGTNKGTLESVSEDV